MWIQDCVHIQKGQNFVCRNLLTKWRLAVLSEVRKLSYFLLYSFIFALNITWHSTKHDIQTIIFMRYDRIIDNAAFWNEKVGNVVYQVKWNCKYFHLTSTEILKKNLPGEVRPKICPFGCTVVNRFCRGDYLFHRICIFLENRWENFNNPWLYSLSELT